jgi:Alpha/beta hydrolase of unknown function (DUF900)
MFYLFPNELTTRTEPSGGDVAPQVSLGSRQGPAGHSRIILLCHGYANSVPAARESYGKFLENFRSQFEEAAGFSGDVFEFFWPGDERYPGISQASYPFQIKNARESGILLANFLNNLPASPTGVLDIYLIAHSLGNRVVLELMKEIDSLAQTGAVRAGFRFRGVLMMAAAVPVSRVEAGGELHQASQLADRRVVLYSVSDLVLKLAFPPGETAAFEGFFPRAVGRFGEPKPQWTFSQIMQDYGHSDYWPRATTSLPVARFLNVAVKNQIAVSQIASNTLPPQNQLGSATLTARPAPGTSRGG